MARKRLKALRYPKDSIEDVGQLVFLHLRFHGYGGGEWTDSAVRRYVTDAGPLLRPAAQAGPLRLHHPQPAQGGGAAAAYDDARGAHRRLREQEELDAIRPDLDGNAIMELLGIAARPAGRPRPTSTCWSCGWSAARSATTRRSPSSGAWARRSRPVSQLRRAGLAQVAQPGP